jgi:hypothetical protein
VRLPYLAGPVETGGKLMCKTCGCRSKTKAAKKKPAKKKAAGKKK